MRHFYRSSLTPARAIEHADAFFPTIGLTAAGSESRQRTFTGPIGTVRIEVRSEGGHYTFVEAHTDQTGESRLDRNVKTFFVRLHKAAHPEHVLEASY